MIAQERYHVILSRLEQNELVKVQELAEEFTVSIETIRRDLEHLEKQKLLRRVHGGAVLSKTRQSISDFHIREGEFSEEKKEIAEFVYNMIPENQMLFMDSSTTNYEIAKLFKSGSKSASLITNSLVIAMELSGVSNVKLKLVGGKVDQKEQSTYGTAAVDAIRDYYADYALISTSGIMEGVGITDYNADLGEVQKIMIRNADKKLIIADSSKFDIVSNYRIAAFDDISMVVTDSKLSKKTLDRYSSLVTIVSK